MSLDELRALSALRASRDIIDSRIAQESGRIFSTGGDSVLAEFSQPACAVRCAASIQRALQEAARHGGEVLTYRTGIHIGRFHRHAPLQVSGRSRAFRRGLEQSGIAGVTDGGARHSGVDAMQKGATLPTASLIPSPETSLPPASLRFVALCLGVACVLAAPLPARADSAYGGLDFSRLSKPQEDFFWRRLQGLAFEEAVLTYCGRADDFEQSAERGIRSCVTAAALDKARASFETEMKSSLESLRQRQAACKTKPRATSGWLGVNLEPAPSNPGAPAAPGAQVAGTVADSPAASAGLEAGDIVARVDGVEIASPKTLSAKIRTLAPGSTVQLGVLRGGVGRSVSVKLGAMAFDAQGRVALDMPELVASSQRDLKSVADEVADLCRKCKTTIWAVFCR